MQTSNKPKVYEWGNEPFREEIDTNSVLAVIDWCRKFSGNHRLPNDVGLPLERCVVGSYQVGYLYDYIRCDIEEKRKEYFEEGIASILIHIIASYEMTGRITACLGKDWQEAINKSDKQIYNVDDYFRICMYHISENAFKYQRWMLYNHMKRTKRWDESLFQVNYYQLIEWCLNLAYYSDSDLSNGFALAMSKIQDGEIKRH